MSSYATILGTVTYKSHRALILSNGRILDSKNTIFPNVGEWYDHISLPYTIPAEEDMPGKEEEDTPGKEEEESDSTDQT